MHVLLCYAEIDLDPVQCDRVTRIMTTLDDTGQFSTALFTKDPGRLWNTRADVYLLCLTKQSQHNSFNPAWWLWAIYRHCRDQQLPFILVLLDSNCAIPGALLSSNPPVIDDTTLSGKESFAATIRRYRHEPLLINSKMLEQDWDIERLPDEKILTVKLIFSRPNKSSTTWQVRWEAPDIGAYTSSFELPFEDSALSTVFKVLDAVQHPDYVRLGLTFSNEEQQHLKRYLWRGDKMVTDPHRHVGQALYQALVSDRDAFIAFTSIRNQANANNAVLALNLGFPSDSEVLSTIPWELMWDEGPTPLLLSRGSSASCVRYLYFSQPLPFQPSRRQKLGILLIAPEARRDSNVHQTHEQDRDELVRQLDADGLIEIEPALRMTPGDLFNRLGQRPGVRPDIVLFYGWSRFEADRPEVLLDSASPDGTWVSIDRFSVVLGDVPMAMFLTRQTGLYGSSRFGASVAFTLASANVPAVLSIPYVSQSRAVAGFARAVCTNLARGLSLQDAVNQGRRAMYVEHEGVAWHTPRLMICTRDMGPFYLIQP